MAGQTCGSGGAACIAAEQAFAFVAGRLAPAERAAVEHRIEACAGCRAVVAEAARRSGAELVRDARGRTAVQRPAATAALRAPNRTPAGGAAAPGADRPVPLDDEPGLARVTGREATSPAVLVDERGEVVGAVRRAVSQAEPGKAAGDATGERRRRSLRIEGGPTSGEVPSAPLRAEVGLAAGEVVGRYVVERALGAGGMGVVSLARDPELRRPVVIKLVHPDVGSSEGGEDFEARLRREAQAMAQVSHANVVQIFDIGRRGDRVFLAMEFVDGQTLDQWLRERPRAGDEIVGVFRQAGAGLAAAHRAGLVHRDFKPSNVLVGRDGIVKVTDFGLARSVVSAEPQGGAAGATRQIRIAPRAASRTGSRSTGVHAVLTQANVVVGTPAYMAPEQAAGGAIDARTDQYALAVTLLDSLLGQPASRRRVAPGDPAAIEAALDSAGVAAPVRAAIVRALAGDPAARFPAVDDLLRALAPAAPPGKSRRAALGVAGVALCGAAAAAWLALGRREPACTSDAPTRWAAARDGVIAALARGPRPFAGWDAARIAEAVDGVVAGLAAAETARCRGTPVAGREGSAGHDGAAGRDGAAECMQRRKDALAAMIAVPGSPPPDDPWSLVRSIERCDPAGSPTTAELRGATAAQVHAIADAAHKAGDEQLAADASEVEGVAALAAGDAAQAAEAFRAMNAAGLQIGSVAVQGRGLLRLIELRRVTGEHDLAVEPRAALDTLLGRSGIAARDVVTAARAEAEAFADLGDVAAAFAAWDRAQAAANDLRDPDAQLAAAIGRARAGYALRFDLDGARTAARDALAAGAAASPAARVAALGVVADLAIAAGDAPAAKQALDQAFRLVPGLAPDPARPLDPAQAGNPAHRGDPTLALDPAYRGDPAQPTGVIGQVRLQRVRALQGDVDGALAELAALAAGHGAGPGADPGSGRTTSGPLAAARIALARAWILLDADHASEARDVLDRAVADLRGTPLALPVAERFELQLAACEARLAAIGDGPGNPQTGDCRASRLAALIEKLHPQAPARARAAELEARGAPADQPRRRAEMLQQALATLLEISAAPVKIAELRWHIARLCADGSDCRRLATAAREAFQAAGRTAEVAEIDRWLADPAAAGPMRRDPAGPQP